MKFRVFEANVCFALLCFLILDDLYSFVAHGCTWYTRYSDRVNSSDCDTKHFGFSSSPGKAPLQRHGLPYLVLLGLRCGWPCRQGARACKETCAAHGCQRNAVDMEQLCVLQMWPLMCAANGILVHLQHWSIVRMPDLPWHQCDCKPTRKWRHQCAAGRRSAWSKDQCPRGRTKPSERFDSCGNMGVSNERFLFDINSLKCDSISDFDSSFKFDSITCGSILGFDSISYGSFSIYIYLFIYFIYLFIYLLSLPS